MIVVNVIVLAFLLHVFKLMGLIYIYINTFFKIQLLSVWTMSLILVQLNCPVMDD